MYKTHTQVVCIAALLVAVGSLDARAGLAEDQYAVAVGHYSRGRWQLAADEFRLFLGKYASTAPKRVPEAVFLLGETLTQIGKHADARDQFSRFLKLAPDHRYARHALFRRGETAYLIGKYDLARRDLEAFRTKYPDDSLQGYALPYLGDMTHKAGDAAGAQRFYVEALQRFPEGPRRDECHLGLGRALEAQGDIEAASRFYVPLAKEQDSPLADDAQLQLGLMQFNRRRYAEAAKTLGVFSDRFEKSELRTRAGYWQGRAHLAEGDWDRAVESLLAATDDPRHPLMPEIVFYAGEAWRRAGRLDEAIRQYDRVLSNWSASDWADHSACGKLQAAFDSDNHAMVDSLATEFDRRFADSPLRPEVRRIFGRSLNRRKRYADAIAVFKGLVESAADTKDQYRLALAYLGEKRYDEGLSTLDAIPLDEVDPQVADSIHGIRASALMGLKKYAAAVGPLRAYLASTPGGADAADCRADLAVALAATGQISEARKAYDELADKHAGHSRVLPTAHYLAEAAFSAGQRDVARELFAILARDGNPTDYVAKGLSGLAFCDLPSDNPANSHEAFQRLLERHPDSPLVPEAAVARARAFQRAGMPDAGIAAYQLVINKYPHSKQLPEALLGAATLYDQLEQDKEAALLLERLVRQHPQLPDLDAVLYRWAWVLVDLDRPEEADAVFTRVYLEHKESRYWADATYRLASRAADSKAYDRASRLAEGIVKARPEGDVFAHTLYLQAQIAVQQGQWSAVAPPLERLLAERPDSPLRVTAQYWLAESAYRQGQHELAGERFGKLAEQTRSGQDPWMALIPLRRAQVLAQQKQWKKAYEIAVKIVDRFPGFAQQYEVDYLLGRCLAAEGRFGEARAAYQRVVQVPEGRKTETAAMAQWMIGETFFHQKAYDEAIRAYSRVETLYDYPRWQAGALLQMGKCYEMKGEWKKAVEHYTHLSKQHPDSEFTEEGTRRLRVAEQRAIMAVVP